MFRSSHPTRRAALAGGLSLLAGSACAETTVDLKSAARRAGIRFGTAVEPQSVESDPDFASLVRSQCGSVTAENAMKWNALRPAPDRFDFSQADRVADFARSIGAVMHGHCLVWHEALPEWVAGTVTSRNAAALLEAHIATVVRRYAGRVVSWDVVNEAVERNDRRSDGLRRSVWLEALGPGYLDLAFHAARQADPRSRLCFADYGLEYDDISWMVEKRGTTLEILRGLKARGVPVDVLALQGHLRGDHPPAFGQGLADFLSEAADLGLEIYVTELDVDDQKTPGSPVERDRRTAAAYARFLETVLRHPAVRMVTTWGLSDRYTSKSFLFPRADGAEVRPLPFDRELRPKPAAFALSQAFSRRA